MQLPALARRGGGFELAAAQAMQEPAERHLARRRAYFVWLLQDMTYQAYERAQALFLVTLPAVSRSDNLLLAQAGTNLTAAFERLQEQYPASPRLRRLLLKLVLRFMGEGQGDEVLDRIMEEAE